MPKPQTDASFLNVDLEFGTQHGLDELLQCFEPSVLVLYRTVNEAFVELNRENLPLEETLLKITELVGALPPRAREIWEKCVFRRANIGIQAGNDPKAAVFGISSEAVSMLACHKIEIVFTVYSFKGP